MFHTAAGWHRDPLVYKRSHAFQGQRGSSHSSFSHPPRPTLILSTKRRHTCVQPRGCSHSHRAPSPRCPQTRPATSPSAQMQSETKPSPFTTQPAGHTCTGTHTPEPQVHPLPHTLPAPPATLTGLTSSHSFLTFPGRPRSPSLLRGWGAEPQVPEVGGVPKGRNCIHMHGIVAQRAAAQAQPRGRGVAQRLRPPS